MKPLLVGLTGGLAAGKSTVANLLREAGLAVWDADRLVSELYQPGRAGSDAVAALFGDQLLQPGGAVDNAALAALVFRNQNARHRLEEAIHPLVGQRFRELAASAGEAAAAVLEGALLVEAGFAGELDFLITVESDPATRRARAVARGLPADDVDRRLAAQGAGEARRAAANWVVENDGDIDALRQPVAQLVAEIRHRAANRWAPPTPRSAPR